MGSPQRISIKEPQIILNMDSSTRRRRRTSTCSNSPEFEFWMVRNPSFPQPNLVSADELFVDGVLLPLHLLHQPKSSSSSHPDPDPDPDSPEPEPPSAQPDSGPEISPASITAEPNSSSKRWKDIIFKKGDKKTSTAAKKQEEKDKDKDKKREKRSQMGASSAELNIINIWPFSRSRSAGNSVTRPKLFPGAPGTRKVSSAPCSRSNSAGESKSRKSWPSSPSRPGVHLGRSSPVWQARRGGGSGMKNGFPEPLVRSGEKLSSKKEVTKPGRSKNIANDNGSTRAKVLNVNVPACIGYRNQLSCRSGENSAIGVRGSGNGGCGRGKNVAGGSADGTRATNSTINVGNGGNLFNFRSLFTKKEACRGEVLARKHAVGTSLSELLLFIIVIFCSTLCMGFH